MDDALLVGRLERLGDLPTDVERVPIGKPGAALSAADASSRQRRPVDQLHDERPTPPASSRP